jgi:hypothetical protein
MKDPFGVKFLNLDGMYEHEYFKRFAICASVIEDSFTVSPVKRFCRDLS